MLTQATGMYLWLGKDCTVATAGLQCCGSASLVLNLSLILFFFQILAWYRDAYWYRFSDEDGIATPCLGSMKLSIQGYGCGSTLRLT